MKGLILNGFYKNFGNIVIMLFTIVFSAIVLITGHATLLPIFFLVVIVAFSAISASDIRRDGEAKWDKYALTLPVRRDEILRCKYISYSFWMIVGVIMVTIVTLLAVSIHGNIYFAYGIRDVFNLYSLGIGIALLLGALFFPFAYLFGIDKSEILLILSAIIAIGLVLLFVWLLNINQLLSIYTRQGLFILIAVLIYVASYFITLGIYRRKEF